MSLPCPPCSEPTPQSLTLTINAAEGLLQAVFAEASGRVVHYAEESAASQGAEKLAPLLASSFAALGVTANAVSRIACVRGPGSFTGLRLACATSAALARATNAHQGALDYLPLLAAACAATITEEHDSTLLWILTHARRGLVYAQMFHHSGKTASSLTPATELDVLPLAESDALASYLVRVRNACGGAQHLLAAGSGAARNREAVLQAASGVFPSVTIQDTLHPDAGILALAATKATYSHDDTIPFYVRPSDAETNLPALAQRLGIDPQEAVRQLRILTSANPDSSSC